MTLQRRDILTYHHERYALNCDILKSYFAAHPALKPEKTGFDSSLHRGYFSEYEIIDHKLLVVDIRVNVDFERSTGKEISKSVIDSALSSGRLCQWFTGDLILFSLSASSTYLRLTIKEGILSKAEALTKQAFDKLGNRGYDYF